MMRDLSYPPFEQIGDLRLVDETAYQLKVRNIQEFLKEKNFKSIPVTFEAEGAALDGHTRFVEHLGDLDIISQAQRYLELLDMDPAAGTAPKVRAALRLIENIYGESIYGNESAKPPDSFLSLLRRETDMDTAAGSLRSPFVWENIESMQEEHDQWYLRRPDQVIDYYEENADVGWLSDEDSENAIRYAHRTPYDVDWETIFADIVDLDAYLDPPGINRLDYIKTVTLLPIELLRIDSPAVRIANVNLAMTVSSEATPAPPPGNPSDAEMQEWQDSYLGTMRLQFQAARARQTDYNIIGQSPEFQNMFSQAFNKETLFLIPLLYNLSITDAAYPQIAESFEAVKNTTLRLYKEVLRGDENAILYNTDVVRSGGDTAESIPPGEQFGLDFRDFVLKAIAEFPLQILKMICELIDPHMALSKLIKDGSYALFYKMEIAINKALDEAESKIQSIEASGQEAPQALKDALSLKNKGIRGKDILTLIFCFINIGIEEGASQIPGGLPSLPAGGQGRFGPEFSMKGIDFKGSFLGMFMLPPTPLGLLYLLFELLKNLGGPDEEFERPACEEVVPPPAAT
jgi:hypothetical protein